MQAIRWSRWLLPVLLALSVASCGSSLVAVHTPGPFKPEGNETLFVAFNVGQADSMLVMHRDKSLLIDVGVSRRRSAKEPFRKMIRRLETLVGERRVDYLVVTHYHADHIGAKKTSARGEDTGLFAFLNKEGFKVGTLIDRGFQTFGPKGVTQRNYEAEVARWLENGTVRERRVVKAGDQIDLGPGLRVEVTVVNTNGRLMEIRARDTALFDEYPPSENDYSVGLKFTQGDFELFNAGDLSGYTLRTDRGNSKQAYNDIESVIAEKVGDIEVYKVNHHGSDHSTNPCFARVLNPEVSIFSTGENSFGHPAPRVFEELKGRGEVLVTGGSDKRVYAAVRDRILFNDVDVRISEDGSKYWVNGVEHRSKTEEEERNRKDFQERCIPDLPDAPDPPDDIDMD